MSDQSLLLIAEMAPAPTAALFIVSASLCAMVLSDRKGSYKEGMAVSRAKDGVQHRSATRALWAVSGIAGAVGRLLRARGFLGVAGAVLVTVGSALAVGSTAIGWAEVTDPGLHFTPEGVVSGLYLLEGKIAFCVGLAVVPVGAGMLFAEDPSLRRLLAVIAVAAGLVLTALSAYTLMSIGERTAAFFCETFDRPGQPGDQFFQQACRSVSNAVDPRVGIYLALEASIASVVGGAFGLRAHRHGDAGGNVREGGVEPPRPEDTSS